MPPLARRIALWAVTMVAFAAYLSSCGEQAETQEVDLQPTISRYRAYLRKESAELLTWLRQLRARVAAADRAGAQSRFASSRVPYGHLEPAAELLGVDVRMDGDSGDPANRSQGYDGLEQALWSGGMRSAMLPSSRLLADAQELNRRVGTAQLPPREIVAATRRVLDDVTAVELRGKESPYAHLDVADSAAAVEGADAAFDAVRPLLEARDAKLTAALERRFAEAFRTLSDFGILARSSEPQRVNSPGTSFVLFTVRSPAEIANLRHRVEALSELFAQGEAVTREAGS